MLLSKGYPASGMSVAAVADDVSVGLDASGSRLLLIAVGDDDATVRDTSSSGVWLLSLPEVHGQQRYLALECRDPRLESVFVSLATEVAQSVESIALEQRRPVVQRLLDRWRQLFAKASTSSMSVEEEAGLLGELVVLERFAAARPDVGIEAWQGPERREHDFRWSDVALEVKTTRAREGLSVSIHGLSQLDVPPDADLHVAAVRVIPSPDGITLPDFVDGLIEKLDGTSLLSKLAENGYVHADHGRGEWTRWRVDGVMFWPFPEDGPALRRSALPEAWVNAISAVRYTLDLGVLGEPMSDDAIDTLWRR